MRIAKDPSAELMPNGGSKIHFWVLQVGGDSSKETIQAVCDPVLEQRLLGSIIERANFGRSVDESDELKSGYG